MTQDFDPDANAQLLRRICRAHHKRVHQVLEEIGLYRGQDFLMVLLWEKEGLTQTELAERMHVQPPTVSNMLQRLEKEGFVERRQDPDDQRVSRVYLTQAGRKLQEPVREAWTQIDEQTFSGFTLEESVLLRRLFMQILENLKEADL